VIRSAVVGHLQRTTDYGPRTTDYGLLTSDYFFPAGLKFPFLIASMIRFAWLRAING